MPKIDSLFREMPERNASDLHIVVGRPPVFRMNGEMVESENDALTPAAAKELLYEILAPAHRQRIEEQLDLDFAYEIEGLARFRANILHQQRGIGGVFRLIPSKILTLTDLGMPDIVRKLSESTGGLILVTGPTGSGKSTTLAAMVNHINETRDAHILTIEDPLEFIHEPKRCLITQREVGAHTADFGSALRVAGRQDPDIILVGEMRDLETISLALTAAACGLLAGSCRAATGKGVGWEALRCGRGVTGCEGAWKHHPRRQDLDDRVLHAIGNGPGNADDGSSFDDAGPGR